MFDELGAASGGRPSHVLEGQTRLDDALVELLFDPVRGAFLTTPNELPGPGRRREDGLEVIDRPASSTPTIAPLHAMRATAAPA